MYLDFFVMCFYYFVPSYKYFAAASPIFLWSCPVFNIIFNFQLKSSPISSAIALDLLKKYLPLSNRCKPCLSTVGERNKRPPCSFSLSSSPIKSTKFFLKEASIFSFQKQIDIPYNYQAESVKKVRFNDIDAYLFRYVKNKSNELMAEHFSFILAEKSLKVLGVTLMDKKYSHSKMLSQKETEIIARDFLKNIDSSLNDELENLWIEKHDEQIIVDGNEKITIMGMKYKCFRSSKNDYAWVIVGFDGTIAKNGHSIPLKTD